MILTHDPKSRICIQIGLGTTAEYIYLAHPQWRKLLSKRKPIKQAQGYKLIHREPTNQKTKAYAKTMELQFLRDDLCD